MGIRYNERSGEWSFDTVADARAFRTERQERPTRPAEPPTQVVGPESARAVQVLPVLWALARAGDAGMRGKELSPIAGLKGPQGLAAFSGAIEEHLRLVTKLPDVSKLFWKIKKPGIPATWYASREKLIQYGVIEREEDQTSSRSAKA